jgi:hypothetical protein
VTFAVAGIRVALRGARFAAAEGFLAAAAPDLQVEVREMHGALSGGLRAARAGSVCRYETRSCRGEVDLRSGRAVLTTTPSSRALEGFLRFVVGCALLERGGLLLHGAGAVHHGSGVAFLGPSEAGKSTIAALAARSGALVLGDEVVALRRAGDEMRIYGTPFGSRGATVASAGEAPLRVLCVLEKAASHAFRPRTRGEVARALLAQTIAAPEAVSGAALLAAAEDIATRVPGGVLEFARDPGFWEVLPNG